MNNNPLKWLFAFIVGFNGFVCYSQLEAHRWYFTNTSTRGITFDFVTGVPANTAEHVNPYAMEGTGIANDPITGSLMFYVVTDQIFDNTHVAMPNGSGLTNSASCFQKGIICPKPGNCDQYYIFQNTSAREVSPGSYYYSIVDMSLPGNGTMASPQGDIVPGQKNIFLKNNTGEASCLIKSTTTDVYWLLVSTYDASEIYVYRIDGTGITLWSNYDVATTIDDYRHFKYSYEAQKFVLVSGTEADPSLLFDFNRTTGMVTSTSTVPGTPLGANPNYWTGMIGAEWSSDGTKLYIGKYRWFSGVTGGGVYQYDLNLPGNPIQNVWMNGGGYNNVVQDFKRAPNGEIYFIYNDPANAWRYLGKINNPNNAGVACNVIPLGHDLGYDVGPFAKFPVHIQRNEKPVAISDTVITTCAQLNDYNTLPIGNDYDPDDDIFSLSIISTPGGVNASVVGGNSINIDLSSVLAANQIIYYSICDMDCFSKCDTGAIILIAPSNAIGVQNMLGNDTSICGSGSILLDPNIPGATYLWQDNSTNPTFNVTQSGSYWVTTSNNGCDVVDTININFYTPTPLHLGNDTSICSGSSFQFVSPPGFTNYLWSNGNTSSQISVNASGTYSLIAEDINGCLSYDTVELVNVHNSPLLNMDTIVTFCDDAGVVLQPTNVDPNVSFLWSTGDTTSSIHTLEAGNYMLTVTSLQGCSTAAGTLVISDCPPTLYIPNAFTPNGDELNNFFKAYGTNIENFKMEIFNRWGQLIYTISHLSDGWDGMHNGKVCPIGVYVFKVTYNGYSLPEKVLIGRVSLIR